MIAITQNYHYYGVRINHKVKKGTTWLQIH